MNREQAEKELREAKQKIAEVEQYLKDNPEDVIMVPDNIHLSNGEIIHFNNDIQYIKWYNGKTNQGYDVDTAYEGTWNHTPHKLIPADKAHLEIEQVYHFTHCINGSHKNKLSLYGIWNGEGFICIENGFPVLDTGDWSYIYKAVPVED